MPKIVLVNNAEPGITEFAKPIEKIISDAGSTFVKIEYKNCIGFNFEQFDGAILSGSPQGDDIVEHHLPYLKWIQNFDKPVFGICAGHHITGFMYGAEILRSIEPESGDYEVEIIKQDRIFKGLPKTLKVKQIHNDSVNLPEEFELLATSKSCSNQMMKHQKKPIYTTQFHPEFYNRDLILNFIALCK